MIIAVGDIHGKFSDLTKAIDFMKIDEPATFVHLGDFGLGFDSPISEYKKLRDLDFVLSKTQSKMLVIRGNHDNPGFWGSENMYKLSNITLVPDNIFMEVEGKMCFFAGGALSIDRSKRTLGVNYWKNEGYKWRKPGLVVDRVDHVFTHEVYHKCSPFNIDSPFTKHWFMIDSSLRIDLTKDQRELEKMYEYMMSINDDFSWYHGHYHESHLTINGNQKTHCLSIMEFKLVQ